MVAANPDRQLQISEHPEECYFGQSPTLASLNVIYGRGAAEAWLLPEVQEVCLFMGIKEMPDNYQATKLVKIIVQQFGYLKVDEVQLFFFNFCSSRYRHFYNTFDPSVIILSLHDFLHDRNRAYEEREEREREREREEWKKHAMTHDEYLEWLKSDSRPKRGKRFFRNSSTTRQVNDNSKESVASDGNQESISIVAETTNDTNSVAEVTDTASNQAEKATSVPEEAVSVCQSPEIFTPSGIVSDAMLEQNGSNDESKDTSTESAPASGTDVDSCMDRREKTYCSIEPLADEHISNDSARQQEKENTIPSIPSFPYFSLERHETTDGYPAKSVIRFFDKMPHNHYYTVCRIAEDRHGKRIVKNTVSFEFATYDDALQAALAIDKYLTATPDNSN